MEIGILLKINIGHRKDDTLHTSKSEYFKRGNIYYETFTLKLIKEESQYQRALVFLFFPHLLDDRYGASHEALGPTDIVANSNGKLHQEFVIIKRKRM